MAVTKIPSKIPGSGPRSETSKSNQLVLVIHYIPSLQKMMIKFVHNFLSHPVDRQADRQTEKVKT